MCGWSLEEVSDHWVLLESFWEGSESLESSKNWLDELHEDSTELLSDYETLAELSTVVVIAEDRDDFSNLLG